MMTTTRALVTRVLRPLLKAVEGQPRRGPYWLPVTGGWLPDGIPTNWWQTGISPVSGERSAIVEACVSAYAQTVAFCPGDHWRSNSRGGRDPVTTSALSRILRRPNAYQSISDFLLNATRSLYLDGNTYALALRNDRYEIDELHLMDAGRCRPQVATTGDVFYVLQGNDVIDRQLAGQQIIVPQRDVLHIRLHTDRRFPRPLLGETPLAAAYGDMAMYERIRRQQEQFYENRAAPSAVLSTDLNLDKDQVQALRDRWNDQSKGLHQGGVPILTAGLRVQPWTTPAPARDMQVAELLKLTNENIALVFRVPLQVLGLASAPFSSTQALMQFWLASGLGFCLNHLEEAFDRLFNLEGEPIEYCEFSTDALLRSDRKDRIEALARAVQGGILSPNEARNSEGFDSVPHGDEPRVQAQVVPLSAAAGIPSAPAAPGPQAAPAVAKNYKAAVQNDVEALRARAKRPGIAGSRGLPKGYVAAPPGIIRKVKDDALQG